MGEVSGLILLEMAVSPVSYIYIYMQVCIIPASQTKSRYCKKCKISSHTTISLPVSLPPPYRPPALCTFPPSLSLPQVVALYCYEAQGSEELTLEEGDIVTVISKEDDVWWYGRLHGKTGMFPAAYVAPHP